MHSGEEEVLTGGPLFSRRGLIAGAFALAATWAAPSGLLAAPPRPTPRPQAFGSDAGRTLSFYHLHTGERRKITYFEQGSYLPDALEELNHLLRDFRSGEVADMDPKLFDLLYALKDKLDTSRPFEVVSAYRSPSTNAALRSRGHGVAEKSFHIQGKAIDISLENRAARDIRNAALDLGRGGVGFYRRRGFVHVDTGPVRKWG
jgi:uncharacterized protein YcbK (DUF882 family)